MIPKRPKQKTSFYRSRQYKIEVLQKINKWSDTKAVKVYYTKFTTRYNPYALDWMDRGRTKVMQSRAQIMFDTMCDILDARTFAVSQKKRCKAIVCALQEYAQRQRQEDGQNYIIVGHRIARLGNIKVLA
tara:strand:+ start:1489 stop:1878 length:390 start_codon:yes stop_codon:yes gene_type:complete